MDGLTLGATVVNLFNRQTPGAFNPFYAASPYRGSADYSQTYGQPMHRMSPRYVRLMVRYEF